MITIFLIILWYTYISFVDFSIHKFIMHNDNTYLKKIRADHKRHHREHLNEEEDFGTSIVFSFFDTIIIGVISGIIVSIILYLIYQNINISLYILGIHIILILIGGGIHNYSHSAYHNHNLTDCFKIRIPKFIIEKLHKHHELHHIDPKKNFCVVFLGFDTLLKIFKF